MANNSVDAKVKCPFYLREDGKMVFCEGMADGTCMITRFRCAAAKRLYMETHCFYENGGACFMAKSLYKKYGEGEPGNR